jgi:hypothetical protein
MKRTSIAGSLLALLAAVALPAHGTNQKGGSDEEGWVSLFDGKTLSDWTMLELPGREGKSKWEVKDGAIQGSGEASMLFSPKGHYKNFKYRAEIKINDKGNSGMYFRTPKKPTFSEGYEAQIDSTHSDPIRTGSIYGFVHVYERHSNPDEWFTYEVDVVDREWRGKIVTAIHVKVNGKSLYEFLDYNRSFKEGHFAFQQHDPGSKVSIRKIEVKELPDTK